MPDRENVIDELIMLKRFISSTMWEAIDIAISILKKQEAVKPKSNVRHGANAQIQHFCGNCNSMLHGKPKYCSECGRPVLWEGR